MVRKRFGIRKILNGALTAAAFLVLGTTVEHCQAASACDLNLDGKVDAADVFTASAMALGATPCTANVAGAGVCNIVVVQRVIDAFLGGTCITDASVAHSITLTWTATTSIVAGYYIYRGAQTGGPYTKLTSSPVVGTTYTDSAVQSGQTYYYVVTAVDASGNESPYSNQAAAAVPNP